MEKSKDGSDWSQKGSFERKRQETWGPGKNSFLGVLSKTAWDVAWLRTFHAIPALPVYLLQITFLLIGAFFALK